MEKQKKSEKLRIINTPTGERLVTEITKTETYLQNIKKGLPLFEYAELEALKEKYAQGLTWEDIDTELSKKGIKLRKATFRKYIQDNYLPKSTGYTFIGTKRFAVFPSDMISQINFINYFYRVADDKVLNLIFDLMETVGDDEMSAYDAIESELSMSIEHNILDLVINGIDDGLCDAIDKIFATQPKNKEQVYIFIDNIKREYSTTVAKSLHELVSFLNNHHVKLSAISNTVEAWK